MSAADADAAAAAAAPHNNNSPAPALHGSWVELERNGNTHRNEATPPPTSDDHLSVTFDLSQNPQTMEEEEEQEEEHLMGGLEHVPSSSSIHDGDMERILLDAQHESSPSNSSRQSPERPPSPDRDDGQITFDVEASSSTDSLSEDAGAEESRHEDALTHKDTDWVSDWSSRPENIPPKEFHFRHPRHSGSFSVRKSGVMKSGGFFSTEILKVFIPSLLLSHVLALGLGVYIGKRIAAASGSTY